MSADQRKAAALRAQDVPHRDSSGMPLAPLPKEPGLGRLRAFAQAMPHRVLRSLRRLPAAVFAVSWEVSARLLSPLVLVFAVADWWQFGTPWAEAWGDSLRDWDDARRDGPPTPVRG